MLKQEKSVMLFKKKIKINFIFILIYILNFLNNSSILYLNYLKNNKKSNLFQYKYYKIFDKCQFFYKKVIFKQNYTFKALLNTYNFKVFFFKFFFLCVVNMYNLFFKFFFFKYKNTFYKNDFNRLFYNFYFFNNMSYFTFLKNNYLKNNIYSIGLKKYIYITIIKGRTDKEIIKKKYYRRMRSIIKIKRFKKIKNRKIHIFIAKLTYKKALSRNFRSGRKRIFYGCNFYLRGMSYFLRWSFNIKNFFGINKLKFNYNLLFLSIFLKIHKKGCKRGINFFKYFVIAKNYLKNRYKTKKYFCLLKKTRSNSFLTLINSFGEVIFSISAGRLNLATKKYKRAYPAIKLFWPLLAKNMKIFSINFVIFLVEPGFMGHFYRIRKNFRRNFLKFKYIPINTIPHNSILKTLKLRRVKRK